MKLSDLFFNEVNCCGDTSAASIKLPDDRTLCVSKHQNRETLDVEFFNSRGLESRQRALTVEQVEALLP